MFIFYHVSIFMTPRRWAELFLGREVLTQSKLGSSWKVHVHFGSLERYAFPMVQRTTIYFFVGTGSQGVHINPYKRTPLPPFIHSVRTWCPAFPHLEKLYLWALRFNYVWPLAHLWLEVRFFFAFSTLSLLTSYFYAPSY